MILDYNYNKKKREFELSYITDNGGKAYIVENIDNMPSYVYDENGPLKDAWGRNVSQSYTKEPSKFDLKNHILSFCDKYKKLINKKTLPKLFTFDIETEGKWENGKVVFSEASEAANKILTISLCSSDLNTVVFGLRPLTDIDQEWISGMFTNYLSNVEYFKELNMPMPYFKYIHYENEEAMLKAFVEFVAKVPVLSGWNCIKYDWQYIVNRIKNYYPNINLYSSSGRYGMTKKKYVGKFGEEIMLPMPNHTYIVDMMEIVETDHYVLPIKESYQLDYIAEASMGINKIQYEDTLQHLYERDYKKYVYYNAIDSILVQLIDKKFNTLKNFYILALYCTESIENCISKIKLTEALFYKYFFEHNVPVVYERKETPARAGLLGAYVKIPTPGKYEFPVCNDFASLYPSSIITCNLSIENYIGNFWNLKELSKYTDSSKYIIIGPNVFYNVGTTEHPSLGQQIGKFLDDEALDPYRKDIKNYFVSVNGCVYKNDKDYSFKAIQQQLKDERKTNKYLAKKLDAQVMYDIDHILKGSDFDGHEYDDQMVDAIALLNMDGVKNIRSYKDLLNMPVDRLNLMKNLLQDDIIFYISNEMAIKLLMNSMYGGSSHVSFYWYNMNLANDITGEARNLTLLMEKHLGDFWTNNWYKMTDLHDKLGIKLKPEYVKAMEERDKERELAEKEVFIDEYVEDEDITLNDNGSFDGYEMDTVEW